MSLFDRISDKIKDDLIIEMNKTGSDDPWDTSKGKKKKYTPPSKAESDAPFAVSID